MKVQVSFVLFDFFKSALYFKKSCRLTEKYCVEILTEQIKRNKTNLKNFKIFFRAKKLSKKSAARKFFKKNFQKSITKSEKKEEKMRLELFLT